jgi:VIT1/CCC1 family predicted Fe2+/Mn2+ transporter
MIIKNILIGLGATVVGLFLGAMCNMGVLMLGPYVISPLPGINHLDINDLRYNIHLFEAKHYVMPFLAHAIGTLVGAFIAVKLCLLFHLSKQQAILSAAIIGAMFLWAGIETSLTIHSPLTPMLVDAILCYIPMALAGYWLAYRTSRYYKS